MSGEKGATMARYTEYEVVHYNEREDGRVEPAGYERLVLSREEAVELSFMALVVVGRGSNGKPIVMHEGRHAQFDAHLGWLS